MSRNVAKPNCRQIADEQCRQVPKKECGRVPVKNCKKVSSYLYFVSKYSILPLVWFSYSKADLRQELHSFLRFVGKCI
jgi:hypothetical protein